MGSALAYNPLGKSWGKTISITSDDISNVPLRDWEMARSGVQKEGSRAAEARVAKHHPTRTACWEHSALTISPCSYIDVFFCECCINRLVAVPV